MCVGGGGGGIFSGTTQYPRITQSLSILSVALKVPSYFTRPTWKLSGVADNKRGVQSRQLNFIDVH